MQGDKPWGQTHPVDVNRLTDALNTHVPNILLATQTPGVAVAVADRSGLIYSDAFGYADLSASTPMRTDHVMPGGSLSKPLISVAILQLIRRGRLDLHEPATRYLGLPLSNPHGPTAVTPYHLLTHQSGLCNDSYDASLSVPPPLAEHVTSSLASNRGREYGGALARWTAPVGVCQYSNFGAAILGYLVARCNPQEMSFTDYLQSQLFDPLGLASTCVPENFTTPATPANILDRIATGYARFGAWCMPTPRLHSANYPSTGVLTTAEDYAQLLAAIMLPGHAAYGALLDPDMVRSMITRHVDTTLMGHRMQFGLNIEMSDTDTPDAWLGGAGQYAFGWNTLGQIYPHHGIAVAAFTNVWDMARWVNPLPRTAAGLVSDVVRRWARGDLPANTGKQPSLSSASAYGAGLLFAERIGGLLSAGGGPLSTDAITAMASGAQRLPDTDTSGVWDADAFVSGAEAMTSAGTSPSEITKLIATSRVDKPLLDLAALTWGASAASFPAPLQYWAARRDDLGPPAHFDLYRDA